MTSVVLSVQACGQTPPAVEEQSIQTTIAQVRPTVVTVGLFAGGISVDSDPFAELKLRGVATPLPLAIGSGVLLKRHHDNGTDPAPLQILTCSHLVATPRNMTMNKVRIAVHFPKYGTFTARIVSLDPRSNLAMLAVIIPDGTTNSPRATLHKAASISAENPAPGDEVIFAGNGLSTLIQGTASFTPATITRTDAHAISAQGTREDTRIGSFLQLESASSPGSGSPVFNQVGELIGLTTDIPVLPGSSRSTINVIPVGARFERIIHDLERGFEVDFGFLGLSPEDAMPDELDDLRPSITQPTCVKANRVSKNSPAEMAGVKSGDLILAVDGIPVLDQHDLIRETSLAAPGSEVTLSIWRPRTRQRKQIAVTLGKSPVRDEQAIVNSQQRHPAWRGLQVDYSTARRKHLPSRFLSEYPPGVVITSVLEGTPAESADLRPGQFITHVNGTTINTPQEFLKAVNKSNGSNVELQLSTNTKTTVAP